ncbi:MAG: hypothetical protein SNH13_07680 [Rikenellaceae bacterium]
MEKRVKLNTITRFTPTDSELERLYILMGLVQYPYDCNPEYRDEKLIRRLCNEFNRFNIEITKASEKDSNNLILTQIRYFIQRHYGYLKRLAKDIPQEDSF